MVLVSDKLKNMNEYLRGQFPSLDLMVDEKRAAFFDGPGGYQVPKRVVDAMDNYLFRNNANVGGAFPTSEQTDEMIRNAREAYASFFNCSWDEVSFGANMTTLNFSLAMALEEEIGPGEEILVTEIDHEANRGPWEAVARKNDGVKVREVELDTDKFVLNMDDFRKKVSDSTKVIAVNFSSNALGTTTDVKEICEIAKEVGAYSVIDAVHYAAHGPIDVKEIGPDFLLCSAYKFFGPHIGILFSDRKIMDNLCTLKVRPQKEYPPYKIETGTLNHEGIAGAEEAIYFVADIGEKYGDLEDGEGLRGKITSGLEVFENYEKVLSDYLREGLEKIDYLDLYVPEEDQPRTSTISLTHQKYDSRSVAEYLASKGIFVWDGDFYATRVVERLNLEDRGGLVRIGVSPYNTEHEVERLIGALSDSDSLREFC